MELSSVNHEEKLDYEHEKKYQADVSNALRKIAELVEQSEPLAKVYVNFGYGTIALINNFKKLEHGEES